ncbi:hypothetical protein OG21DRAFT_1056124 [Imleria badia]|nr:hypothetical protein OG21DRAFT_1056124 [Imleria badia]
MISVHRLPTRVDSPVCGQAHLRPCFQRGSVHCGAQGRGPQFRILRIGGYGRSYTRSHQTGQIRAQDGRGRQVCRRLSGRHPPPALSSSPYSSKLEAVDHTSDTGPAKTEHATGSVDRVRMKLRSRSRANPETKPTTQARQLPPISKASTKTTPARGRPKGKSSA